MYPWTVYPSYPDSNSVKLNDAGGDLLVIAGIHGDEPGTWKGMIDFYRDYADQLTKPVTFLFANPYAAQNQTRFVQTDLNRNFGSGYNPKESSFEMRLAGHLHTIIERFDVVVSLHSTQSTNEPFALFGMPIKKSVLDVIRRVGISKAVLIKQENQRGSLVTYPNVIEFECGKQHSETAKENSKRIIRDAIASIDGLEKENNYPQNDVKIFEMKNPILKSGDGDFNIYVESLKNVLEGELVAESASKKLIAPKQFTPILMSENGYDDILGYYGTELGWLSSGHISIDCNDSSLISSIEFIQSSN